ncbi:hypothetical protein WJX72_010390 [[Myrmecia] bisecta]|uniref:CAAX prenyl protease 2/Lysostaphin resistance protein A-like domain-containing protein n=1 Tax=[Myrmecia] bisecta TaxID=41462 RepID=A0AAW1PMH8_9CHLO
MRHTQRIGGKPSSSKTCRTKARCSPHKEDSPADAKTSAILPGKQEAIWQVPWDEWFVAQVMIQIWAIILPLGFYGVTLTAELHGITVQDMTDFDKITAATALEVVQLAAVLYLVRRAIRPYQPSLSNWFSYRLDAQTVPVAVTGAVVGLVAVAAIAQIAPAASPRTEEIKGILGGSVEAIAAVIFLLSAGLAPVLEEFIFRGFLLASLTKWMPVPGAVLVGS